jgi:plasmid stabilization system protein ParE
MIAAQDWYELQSPGLGARFREELEAQVERMAEAPQRFPFMFKDVRRARLRQYPYGLFFRVLKDGVYVIACFHSRRDPTIWRDRIES